MLIVPFTSDYDQTFRTQLGDDTYVIDARWNERAQYWTFDLTRDSDSTLLVAGIPMLVGQDVLAPYALGIGGIFLTDLSNTNSDAGPDDLSDRVVPIYFTPAELDILAANGVAGTSGGGAPIPSPTPPPPAPPAPGPSPAGTTIVNNTITNLALVGGGFGSDTQKDDDSGAEVLAYQWPINAGLNPNAMLKAIAALIVEGTGTVRMYLGGGPGTIGTAGVPSGTFVGAASASGLAEAFISGTPIANPGGLVTVKLTLQSAAPATTVQVDGVNGAVG